MKRNTKTKGAQEAEIQRLTKEVEELKGKVKYRSFEEFFLNNHPDPDHLFAKTIEEAWPELCKLAQNFRGPEMGHKKRITLVWPDPKESGGFNEVTSGSVVELTDDAVVYLDKLKVWDENTRLRELLGTTSGGLSNLVFTADKLWDEVKPIKDSDAITVTHPIIEEAKQLLTEINQTLKP